MSASQDGENNGKQYAAASGHKRQRPPSPAELGVGDLETAADMDELVASAGIRAPAAKRKDTKVTPKPVDSNDGVPTAPIPPLDGDGEGNLTADDAEGLGGADGDAHAKKYTRVSYKYEEKMEMLRILDRCGGRLRAAVEQIRLHTPYGNVGKTSLHRWKQNFPFLDRKRGRKPKHTITEGPYAEQEGNLVTAADEAALHPILSAEMPHAEEHTL